VTGIGGTTQLHPLRAYTPVVAGCWLLGHDFASSPSAASCPIPAASSDAASRDGALIIYFRTIRLVTHSIRQSAALRPPYWSCALEAVLKKDPSTRHWPLGGLSSRPDPGNPFATSPTPLAIRLVDALPLAHTASPPPFFPSLSPLPTAAAPATTSHSRSSATSTCNRHTLVVVLGLLNLRVSGRL
jgi:hypothetical protein